MPRLTNEAPALSRQLAFAWAFHFRNGARAENDQPVATLRKGQPHVTS